MNLESAGRIKDPLKEKYVRKDNTVLFLKQVNMAFLFVVPERNAMFTWPFKGIYNRVILHVFRPVIYASVRVVLMESTLEILHFVSRLK